MSQNGELVSNSFATNDHPNIALFEENKRSIEECNNIVDAHEDSFASGKMGFAPCRQRVQSDENKNEDQGDTNSTGNIETSETSSKPPGFNGVRFHSPLHSDSESPKIRQLKKQYVNVGSLIAEMEKYVEFGKILGYDLSGCKDDISKMIDRMGIKDGETKMVRLDLFLARSVWGNYNFEVASSGARGRSGGLLMMWDPAVFRHNKVWSFDHTLIVLGEIVKNQKQCYLVNIYAPQDRQEKQALWGWLTSFMNSNVGNGRTVSFWNYIWVGEHRLQDKFPRLFDMESNKESSIDEHWFKISGLGCGIEVSEVEAEQSTNWERCYEGIEMVLNMPASDNISSMLSWLESIDVHRRRILEEGIEMVLNMPASDNISSMLSWLESIDVHRRRILEVIVYATVWCIWRFRNGVVFKDSNMKKSLIFESIVINSFQWFSSRYKKHNIPWTLWLQNPMLHSFV
ncbi:RNA-directed DNA polymerase, eukaryota [Artemisia annua]|uniref:RNA-directed DNA polymerase, eukaryota n=1 Tax=Artemisia annua TaxID=35608 RepID=A0A2U1M4Z6_ARTAN|nr:RNA-directed DNA polymerase, eukaryota [Artemisia annua]